MKTVEAKGDWRTIGRTTGEATREEVAANLTMHPADVDSPDWQKRLPTFIDAMKRHLPHVLEEMEGLAEGANVPFEQIAYKNLPVIYANDLIAEDGCTNVVFAHGPDGPVLGKNNDGNKPERQQPPVCRMVSPPNGMRQITFTFAGMVAFSDALNEAGVAIGHSSVGSVFQQSDRFAPIRPWVYDCMFHATSTADLIERMSATPLRGKGYAMVAVDKAGVARSLEAPCPVVQVRAPGEGHHGHVHCVNVYQLPHLSEADRRNEKGKCNAQSRWQRLNGVLANATETNIEGMKSVLRMHRDGDAAGVCRHMGEDLSLTEFSYIAVPQHGEMLFCHGQPCACEYESVGF